MRYFLVTGIILTLVLFLFSTGLADELTSANTTNEKAWEGTWTDVNYSLSIEQNGSEISGIGKSFDIGVNDPFLLSGNISEDGKTLDGIMRETGTLIMNISDDKMAFSANGTIDPVDNMSEIYAYTTRGTRNGTSITPESTWNGAWKMINSSMNINQNGNYVTGEYHPYTMPENGGVFEGTVSGDGKTLSIKWIYAEKITFNLSDDRNSLIESYCGETEKAAGEVCLNLTKKQ